jgi:DNA end-binding protein Ku
MNAGIADATNLSWLMAAHLNGWAPASILDAYEAERLPITNQVSRFAMAHAEAEMRRRGAVPDELEEAGSQGEAARAEGYTTIEISDFVPYEQIDPIYFARTYYLGPQEGGEKVYGLLTRAMEGSGLAAIAKFVMRDRQNLGCLRIRDGVITLEQLYFADEIRDLEEIKPAAARVPKEELAMAEQLIDNFAGDFEPEKYHDTYRDALCEVIKAKRKGKEVHRAPETEEAPPPDLLEALRASIAAAGKGGGRRGKSARNGANAGLSGLSKTELERRAKEANIAGRSKMSKDELIEALSEAA